MGRRREQRIEISLPVRVWGLDRNGNPFIQSAYTMDVTRNGARLRDIFCLAKTGEVVRIQHGLKKANFRITWIGHPGSAADGQVGIHSIDPDKYIWGIPLPKASPVDAYEVAYEVKKPSFSSPREMRHPASASTGYSPTALATETARITRIEGRSGEMRARACYACNGTVEVGPEGSGMPIWCRLSDLSISGCYAETTAPLPVGTRVYARLKIFGTQVQTHGTIRTSHPGAGMGISFAKMNEEDQRRIYCILEIMAEKAENGGPAFAPNPNSILSAPKPAPAPLHTRSLLVVHNRSQQENAKTKKTGPTSDPKIADRLRQLNRELQELPQALHPEGMDPRIMQELKNTFELARHTVAAVQHWMELQSQNRDPFHVLNKLNGERVRGAAGASHRLAMDIDAGEIDFDTEGLNELHESNRNLYTRLQKLFKKV